jgi:hypothetical protein
MDLPSVTPRRDRLALLAGLATLALATACGVRPLSGTPAAGAGGAANGRGGGGAGASGGAAGGTGGPTGSAGACATGGIIAPPSQCSDGIDNDGDGKIDYDDPECLGALDNDESSFADGIPGDNLDPCKLDCAFDGNSGMGDDNCIWQLKCDPISTATYCPYDQTYATAHPTECSLTASQTQICLDRCAKLTANGCDCFGCCVVPGAPTPIRLAVTCTAADFGDPTKCPPCTQVTQCMTPCGHCDYCIGKETLPSDCVPDAGVDSGTPNNCLPGYPACGPGGIDPTMCPTGTGCVTGCCRPLVP